MTTSTASARPRADIADPRRLAADLASRDHLWRDHVRFGRPRHYVRLLTGTGWEAWLLTWLPGQATGLHDHGGSAGAFAVLDGVLDETLLVHDRDRMVRRNRPYAAGEIRAFGRHHVHDVAPTGGPAVGLHVYAPALTRMTRYALEDGALVTLANERAGADW
jgi:predicted metal-dependent enzyme (double-stranded beta helix superfamily)